MKAPRCSSCILLHLSAQEKKLSSVTFVSCTVHPTRQLIVAMFISPTQLTSIIVVVNWNKNYLKAVQEQVRSVTWGTQIVNDRDRYSSFTLITWCWDMERGKGLVSPATNLKLSRKVDWRFCIWEWRNRKPQKKIADGVTYKSVSNTIDTHLTVAYYLFQTGFVCKIRLTSKKISPVSTVTPVKGRLYNRWRPSCTKVAEYNGRWRKSQNSSKLINHP